MATERFYEKVEYRRFLAEPGMQLASSEVRGAWFWTLCHMWGENAFEFTRTVADWALSWNCSRRQAVRIIGGLGEKDGRKGIANVTCHGDVTLCHSRVTIQSRFLARRDKERSQAVLRQRRHRDDAHVTDTVTPHVTPHSNSNSNSNSKEEKKESVPPALNDTWNEMAAFPQLPKVTMMTAKRKATLRVRWADPFFRENWAEAMAKIPGCPFLIGQSERGWRADFDWFLKPDTVAKILEGKYDAGAGAGGKSSARSPRRFASADEQDRKYYPKGKFADHHGLVVNVAEPK